MDVVVVVVLKVIKVWAPDNGKGLGKGHRPNSSVAIPPPQRLDEQVGGAEHATDVQKNMAKIALNEGSNPEILPWAEFYFAP